VRSALPSSVCGGSQLLGPAFVVLFPGRFEDSYSFLTDILCSFNGKVLTASSTPPRMSSVGSTEEDIPLSKAQIVASFNDMSLRFTTALVTCSGRMLSRMETLEFVALSGRSRVCMWLEVARFDIFTAVKI